MSEDLTPAARLEALKQQLKQDVETRLKDAYKSEEDLDVGLDGSDVMSQILDGHYFAPLDEAADSASDYASENSHEQFENEFDSAFEEIESDLEELCDELDGTDAQFDVDEWKDGVRSECRDENIEEIFALYSTNPRYRGSAKLLVRTDIDLTTIKGSDGVTDGNDDPYVSLGECVILNPDGSLARMLALFRITPKQWVEATLVDLQENDKDYENMLAEQQAALAETLRGTYLKDIHMALQAAMPGFTILGEPCVDPAELVRKLHYYDVKDISLEFCAEYDAVESVWGNLTWIESAFKEIVCIDAEIGGTDLAVSGVEVPLHAVREGGEGPCGTGIQLPQAAAIEAYRELVIEKRSLAETLTETTLSLDWLERIRQICLHRKDVDEIAAVEQVIEERRRELTNQVPLDLGPDQCMTQLLANMCVSQARGDVPVEEIRQLVRLGADPKWRDSEGNTLLHLCATSANLEMAKFLIEEFGPEQLQAVNHKQMTAARMLLGHRSMNDMERADDLLNLMAAKGADLAPECSPELARTFANHAFFEPSRVFTIATAALLSPDPNALFATSSKYSDDSMRNVLTMLALGSQKGDHPLLQQAVNACSREVVEVGLGGLACMQPPQNSWVNPVQWQAEHDSKMAPLCQRLLELTNLESQEEVAATPRAKRARL